MPLSDEEIKKLQDDLAAEKARAQGLEDENKKLKVPPKKEKEGEGEEGDDDLREKARKEREALENKGKETKSIEGAIKFNIAVDDLLKSNKEILPATLESIVKTAKSENYGSDVARANAMRAAIVQEFFSLQENLDMLTASQRSGLDSFLKLAKNIREERAEVAYDTFFEPTLNSIKQAKKAAELERAKHGSHSEGDSEKAYKERLMKHSRKALLGAKETA